MGRVYVFLMDGEDAVCFWRGECKDFADPNPPCMKWCALTNDESIGKVKNAYDAGMVSIKMSINHKTKNGSCDFTKYNAWRKPPPKRYSSYRIRCFVYQCKDIPSADSDGSSDPYIVIWNPDEKKV
jgi:hypothetical protein